ncbi:L-threonylcarbamoyladenylate synthase [Anaerolinea sp.]|uniref:L-threonylcarbamoyladenylate synthase n=1 Tax=Anaerolinea sp. TaxID=1872519 RepID=UPI002ACE9201|nr:L-threonylcarbamoyladenylate synthase [Anaerolinea sp.]
MTRRIFVDSHSPALDALLEAAECLRSGGLVAFPTETVYGLGGNALDGRAVQRIFEAKGRPANDPLIVHLPSADALPMVVKTIPTIVSTLAEHFWPGPLTLILPRGDNVPLSVTAGLDTVAVRVPSHPVAQALLRVSRLAIAAPSANRFGGVSPTTAEHVLRDLEGRIEIVLDGGATPIGVESTVLDITSPIPRILRPGGVSREALEAVLGQVELVERKASREEAQASPGLLDKHYAPHHARLILLEISDPGELWKEFAHHVSQTRQKGLRAGALIADEDLPYLEARFPELPRLALGSLNDLGSIARNLYAGMRAMDEAGIDVLLVRDFGTSGIGLAIRDRLYRAASQIIRRAENGA